MKYAGLVSLVTTSLITLLPFQAQADVTDIRNSDSAFDISAGANQLRYGENINGTTFDTEKGWQPDFNIGAGIILSNPHPLLNDLYLRGDANMAIGDTYYNGGVCDQFGHCVPSKSTTHDQIYNFSGKIGHIFPLGSYFSATPFVDIGYHYWHRELTGIGGYTEEYGNGTAMGGAMVQFSPLPKWVLTLSGEAGTTFAPTLHAFDTSFQLQTRTVYEADAKVGYEFAPRFEVFGKGSFTGFDYGASPVVANIGNEPESSTHDFQALVGIAYHFKEGNPAPTHRQPSYTSNNATYQSPSSASAKGF